MSVPWFLLPYLFRHSLVPTWAHARPCRTSSHSSVLRSSPSCSLLAALAAEGFSGGLLRAGRHVPVACPLPCPCVIWALLHFSLQAHLAFSLTQGTQVPVIGESHWEIKMWAPGVTDAPGMPLLLADRGRTWGNAHGHAYLQFLVIHLSSSALS